MGRTILRQFHGCFDALMNLFIVLTFALFLFSGCGGGDDKSVPTAAASMNTKLVSDMDKFMPRVARFEAILIFILNPASPLAQGLTLTPDTSPNAPPNSFTFSGDYDGNEDGIKETTLSGRATFDSDPNVEWSRVEGDVNADVNLPLLGHVFHAKVNYIITPTERYLWGSGTFMNLFTRSTTSMKIDALTPLVAKPAMGIAGAVPNACGYNFEGPMELEVTGWSGNLKSTWNFSPASGTVQVSNSVFIERSGNSTVLPDSTTFIPCGGGTTDDWAGTYLQQWACLPRASGEATITISKTGSDTVGMVEKDTNSGDQNIYPASATGTAHSLRGSFFGGPPGNRYRQDFSSTLRRNLSGFSRSSSYVYLEGPKQGTGGLCVVSATRS
jgi:hypothetical protein